MACQIPFEERKTPWRGVLDLATGCYPRFLFGGPTEGILPAFHFHEVTPESLEPYLVYLVENGYQGVTSDAINAYVRKGISPGKKKVVITFDDAWLSLWTVALPILQKYDFTAIAYVSPGRIPEANSVRPTINETGYQPSPPDKHEFASWPELKAICESGVIDLQAHSFSHSSIFCDNTITGFVTPGYRPHLHLRPLLNESTDYVYASPNDLGCPLYSTRSRLSDAFRFYESRNLRNICINLVNKEGGKSFFDRPDWQNVLIHTAAKEASGRFETSDERQKAILNELILAMETLNARIPGHQVNQMCFPFAISGKTAESLLAKAGYQTAFADRLLGLRAIKNGGNPYRLMRLKHQFIFCLPGKGRQNFLAARKTGNGSAGTE